MIFSYTKSMNTLIVSVATYQTRTKDQIEKGEPDKIATSFGNVANKIYNAEDGTVYKYIISSISEKNLDDVVKETGIEEIKTYMDKIKNAKVTNNTTADIEKIHRKQAERQQNTEENQIDQDVMENLGEVDKDDITFQD